MISKRLQIIGDLVPTNSRVIDVGADHGELEKYISSKVNYVLAIENKVGPYNILLKAVSNLENVKTSLSDGLSKLDETIDTIVIAGMGGNLIKKIISKKESKLTNVKQIIVDAHKDIELVRRYLSSIGFRINKEVLVDENNHYYFVMSFVKGTNDYSDLEYEFGRVINNDLFKEYLKKEIERLEDIYLKSNDENIKHKIERIRSL